jgi:hypothetical protein
VRERIHQEDPREQRERRPHDERVDERVPTPPAEQQQPGDEERIVREVQRIRGRRVAGVVEVVVVGVEGDVGGEVDEL